MGGLDIPGPHTLLTLTGICYGVMIVYLYRLLNRTRFYVIYHLKRAVSQA